MTQIKAYGSTPQSSGSDAAKGSVDNPYTEAEYEALLENDTWPGGYVEGLGYCGKAVIVTASYPDSDSMGSDDSWPSEDSFENPWGSDGNENDTDNSSTGSNQGGQSGNAGGAEYVGGGGNSGSGGGNNNNPGTYNITTAVSYLEAHAYPSYNNNCGHCARAVREALEAGGLSTTGHPTDACDYDSFLPLIGFHLVSKNNYSPEKGDIIVLEAVEGHSHGHIAMYSGNKWISDFVQNDMWGGPAYRNKAEYSLFRR